MFLSPWSQISWCCKHPNLETGYLTFPSIFTIHVKTVLSTCSDHYIMRILSNEFKNTFKLMKSTQLYWIRIVNTEEKLIKLGLKCTFFSIFLSGINSWDPPLAFSQRQLVVHSREQGSCEGNAASLHSILLKASLWAYLNVGDAWNPTVASSFRTRGNLGLKKI